MDRKILFVTAILVMITLPVLAQMEPGGNSPMLPGQGMPDGMMGGMGSGMMGGMSGQGMMGGGMGSQMGMMGRGETALDQCLMMHVQHLGLADDQMRKLRTVMTDLQKEKINLTSQIQIKEIDLHTMLMADTVDMRKVETQVRAINTLQGDLQLASIRAFEAGKKVLTPDQLQRLQQTMMMCTGTCPMMGGMPQPMMGGMGGGMMGGMSRPGGMGSGGQNPPDSPGPGR